MSSSIHQIARYMRPKKFSEVVGQDNAVKIVHLALQKNLMLPVCTIFGPSGVGKTTLARLIGMWQCCEHKVDNEPCGKCVNCTAIVNDNHPDVFELDGGAYTGVDDIKNMLSNIDYKTSIASKRIYILDEVHMLSKHAITSLLKRFEEPTKNVQFILATTNPDKIPDTLLSRSFRIVMHSVEDNHICDKLRNICDENGIKYELQALEAIAKYSYGSVRQAMSYLEQAFIISENNVQLSDIESMLGRASNDLIDQLVHKIRNKNTDIMDLTMQCRQLNPVSIASQIIERIKATIHDNSSFLTNFMYDLAESALILHKCPFAHDMLDVAIVRAIIRNSNENNTHRPQSEFKLSLAEEARKMFNLKEE